MKNQIKAKDILIDKTKEALYLVLTSNLGGDKRCCYIPLSTKPHTLRVCELETFLIKLEKGEMEKLEGDLVQKEFLYYTDRNGEWNSIEITEENELESDNC